MSAAPAQIDWVIRKLSVLLAAIALALTLSACVVFPTNRTYFEPNAADGKPIQSASCGYHRTANDGVSGLIGTVEIEIFPAFADDRPLQVHLRIPRSSPQADLLPELIVLNATGQAPEIHASTTTRQRAGPYFNSVVDLVFPVEAGKLTDFSIEFLRGSVSVAGTPQDAARFRFSKIQKTDIYYGSINC